MGYKLQHCNANLGSQSWRGVVSCWAQSVNFSQFKTVRREGPAAALVTLGGPGNLSWFVGFLESLAWCCALCRIQPRLCQAPPSALPAHGNSLLSLSVYVGSTSAIQTHNPNKHMNTVQWVINPRKRRRELTEPAWVVSCRSIGKLVLKC